MFGYVMINKGDLKVRELETYQSFYCGLCQKLKERYGLSGQLTLSYDLTFVVLLLTGLYEPKVKKGTTHCVIHPLKKQPIQVDVFSDYAADMSILLNYYKCMDDWADEQKIDRRLFAELLKRKFGGLEASYSEKAEKVKELLGIVDTQMNVLHGTGVITEDLYTEYKGAFYGTAYSDLEQFRYIGKKLIAIMDINGALNVKRHYPDNTSLLYIERPKEDCIRSILQRTISIDEIVSRISSIDEEQKNKKFCDYIIQNNKDLNNTVNEILHIMEDK